MQKSEKIDEDRGFGGYIVCPFKLSGSNKSILVNRGFLADEFLKKESRDANSLLESEDITIEGVFREKGDKPMDAATTMLYKPFETGNFNQKNHGTIAQYFVDKSDDYDEVVIPVCIDENVDSPSKNYDYVGTPIGGQTRLDVPNSHAGYVVQWFGLAACIFYIYWTKLRGGANLLAKKSARGRR